MVIGHERGADSPFRASICKDTAVATRLLLGIPRTRPRVTSRVLILFATCKRDAPYNSAYAISPNIYAIIESYKYKDAGLAVNTAQRACQMQGSRLQAGGR